MVIYGIMIFTAAVAFALRWFLRQSALSSGPVVPASSATPPDLTNTPNSSAVAPPANPSLDNTDRETIAWIKGGPMRVMELWFAHLVSAGHLSAENGRFERLDKKKNAEAAQDQNSGSSVNQQTESQAKNPEEGSPASAELSFFENQALSALPVFGHTSSMRHLWRRSLRRLQIFLIKNNVLLMPSPARFRLYRLLMGCLFVLHVAALIGTAASLALWVASCLFWLVLLPFLFLMHLKVPVNPYEIARVKDFEEIFQKDPNLLEERDDVMTYVALFGSAGLLGTKWENLVLGSPVWPLWRLVF